MITDILNYIESLKNESFEGWNEEAIKGYLTACISIEEKIKELENIKSQVIKNNKSKSINITGKKAKIYCLNQAYAEYLYHGRCFEILDYETDTNLCILDNGVQISLDRLEVLD